MTILAHLVNLIGTYWFAVVPEIIFLLIFGIRFVGPWAAGLALVYSIGLVIEPAVTMALVAVLIIVAAVVLMIKSIAGDILSKNKESDGYDVSKGVPKLSGQNKIIQDALDEMQRRDGKQQDAFDEMQHRDGK